MQHAVSFIIRSAVIHIVATSKDQQIAVVDRAVRQSDVYVFWGCLDAPRFTQNAREGAMAAAARAIGFEKAFEIKPIERTRDKTESIRAVAGWRRTLADEPVPKMVRFIGEGAHI